MIDSAVWESYGRLEVEPCWRKYIAGVGFENGQPHPLPVPFPIPVPAVMPHHAFLPQWTASFWNHSQK